MFSEHQVFMLNWLPSPWLMYSHDGKKSGWYWYIGTELHTYFEFLTYSGQKKKVSPMSIHKQNLNRAISLPSELNMKSVFWNWAKHLTWGSLNLTALFTQILNQEISNFFFFFIWGVHVKYFVRCEVLGCISFDKTVSSIVQVCFWWLSNK